MSGYAVILKICGCETTVFNYSPTATEETLVSFVDETISESGVDNGDVCSYTVYDIDELRFIVACGVDRDDFVVEIKSIAPELIDMIKKKKYIPLTKVIKKSCTK